CRGVVECETRPCCCRYTKPPHRGHRTVMTGANRNPTLTIQNRGDIVWMDAIQYTGEDRRLLGRGADDPKARKLLNLVCGSRKKPALMFSNPGQSDPRYVFDRRTQTDGRCNRRCARLKFVRQVVVCRLFECYGANHFAAALERRHRIEQKPLPVSHANAGWTVKFVAGKSIKIAIESLYIDRQMRNGLRPIDQYNGAALVRHLNQLFHGMDRTNCVGNVSKRHQLRSIPQELLILVDSDFAGVVYGGDLEPRS